MERFLTEEGVTFVVDNGASTCLPLWEYLLENAALAYLRQQGRRVYVHTVITGGQALIDTLNGFNELAQTTEERNIVIWVNEYFGRVEADGKKFSEMAAYRDNADKVCGAVIFTKRNQDTFGRDVEDMVSAKLDVRGGHHDRSSYDHGQAKAEARSARPVRATRQAGLLIGDPYAPTGFETTCGQGLGRTWNQSRPGRPDYGRSHLEPTRVGAGDQ